jgi:hypothetical protein
MEQQITELDKADRMTTDPKFQPLVDDLKNWLELEKQKETAKAAGLNSVMDAFRPTANYLEQLGKELKNSVDQTTSPKDFRARVGNPTQGQRVQSSGEEGAIWLELAAITLAMAIGFSSRVGSGTLENKPVVRSPQLMGEANGCYRTKC